ncbi:hypothetical protein AB0436_16045 [Streptomyces sp. NPDC051322]|uniref:hypothetical protein n=1 Tax=Streptomyces sp. NPDC051322 TaxID=3154645 RepID=UPI00344C229B
MTPSDLSARPYPAVPPVPAVALATAGVLLAAAPGARAATEPGAGGPDTGISALLVPLLVVLVAGGLAIFAYARRKRRAETRTTPAGSRRQQGWTGTWAPTQPAQAPLHRLDSEARRLLADTEQAIRRNTEELAVVTAQFGQEAAVPFAEALTFAGNRLSTAVRIRQQLDDAPPESDTTERRMLDEIVALCTEAEQHLAAEALHRDP